jgi:multidrug efflux system outer membrane protein
VFIEIRKDKGMSLRNIVLYSLIALLPGCSLAPTFERPAMPTSASYPGVTAENVSMVIELPAWRDFFADPRLLELISQAIENNRDLRIAMRRVEEARAQYGIQRSELLPTISAGSSFTRSRVPGDLSLTGRPLTTQQYQATLNLSTWELDFWGRVRSLKEEALETYLATEEARRAVLVSLVAQVANTYLLERALDEQIAIARETIASREESYRIAKRRYEVGYASQLDAAQAEALKNQAQADLLGLLRQRDQNRNALTLLVGIPIASDAGQLSQIEAGFSRDISAGLPSDLLINRPDVVAAEHRLKAANADIGAARAAFFPSITMTADFGSASSQLNGLFSAGSRVWSFVPSLSLPIFAGGRLQSSLDLSEVRRNLAVADYERTIQGAFREVADALADRHWLAEQVAAEQATLTAQNGRLRLARLRYESGTATYLDVLDAERDRFQVEQVLVQTRRALLVSSVNLYAALGGGAMHQSQLKLEEEQ